ncbi:15184_t:CDS:2, partial [Racocetra fulgida]
MSQFELRVEDEVCESFEKIIFRNTDTKIKECDSEYTSKLSRILTDISKSKDLSNEFNEYYSTKVDNQENCYKLFKTT